MRNRAVRGCLIVVVAFMVASALAKQSKPRPAEKQEPRTSQSDNQSKNPIAQTLPSLDAFPITHDESPTKKASESDSEYPEWLEKLFSDLKITDVLLTLFTAALAIYTYLLYKATAALADADRPHVLMAELTMSGILGQPQPDGNVTLALKYTFANTGRSPAFFQTTCVNLAVVKALPLTPSYLDVTTNKFILAVENGYGSIEPVEAVFSLDKISAIINKSEFCFIYGFISYNDVAKNVHKTRFAYWIDWGDDNTSKRFVPVEQDEYWEYT